MRATFFGLELGKRALFTSRGSMDVTSHNIANAGTEGYARQRAVVSATDPWSVPSFNSPTTGQQLGTGVEITRVENLRDMFIDEKILREKANLSYHETADDLMKEVEAIINEPGETTIGDQLDRFWAAWEDLSVSPDRSELRVNLKEESETLVSFLKDVDTRLRDLQGLPDHNFQGSIENQLEDALSQVNNLVHQIGDLNVTIEQNEVAEGRANDLRDRRQKALDELEGLLKVDCTYDSKGHLKVTAGTQILVDHSQTHELKVVLKDGETSTTLARDDEYPQVSNHPEVASATFTHTENLGTATITVSQMAQAEKQESHLSFFPINGPLSQFGVTSGTFTVNGRTFYLDAEHTTIEGLAGMINAGGLNLTATINEGGRLVLDANLTGKDNGTVICAGTSNLTSILNLQMKQIAQDAVFTVGNREYSAAGNRVEDVLPGVSLEITGKGVANLDLRPMITGGKIKGLLEVRDGSINNLRKKFDELVGRLVLEVNDVHRKGFGLDGETGRNFFKPLVTDNPNQPWKDAVQNLAIDDGIIADIGTIAASQGTLATPGDLLPTYNGDGDGKNAILIAQIKQKSFFHDGKANFSDFYNEIVTQNAVESQRFGRERSFSEDLMTQLDAKREEISGVSLDEELANLVKYQHSYNAAAKVISTVDSMLDKIINGMI